MHLVMNVSALVMHCTAGGRFKGVQEHVLPFLNARPTMSIVVYYTTLYKVKHMTHYSM